MLGTALRIWCFSPYYARFWSIACIFAYILQSDATLRSHETRRRPFGMVHPPDSPTGQNPVGGVLPSVSRHMSVEA